MKKIAILLFTQFFNFWKIKSPVLWGTVVAPALLWMQTQLADPAVLDEIIQAVPDAPAIVIRIIKWLPAILLALSGAHTSEVVKENRRRKGKL
jgi:hypothetical protein